MILCRIKCHLYSETDSLKSVCFYRHDDLLGLDQERLQKLYTHCYMDMHNYDNTPMQYTANFSFENVQFLSYKEGYC